jgi:Holliday junction resolvase RusA-like endonuclease
MRDADDLLKSLDGLNGVVWQEDGQISMPACAGLQRRPRLPITVETLQQEPGTVSDAQGPCAEAA